jgi:Tol biopolymer transport system component
VSDTLAAVLTQEFDPKALPASTPAAIRGLLRRCLERNPKNRLHDIADARIVIDDILSGRADTVDTSPLTGTPGATLGGGWPIKLAWLGAGLVLGAAALAGLDRTLFQAPPTPPPVVRSLTYSGKSRTASIAADRRNVAFVSDRDGTQRIWVKQLATGEEVALTSGTDDFPRVSPDGSSLLFLRRADRGSELFRVPLIGGEPRRLAGEVMSADWSPDGTQIAFSRDDGQHARVMLIPADGGEEKPLAENEGFLRGVAWSPNGARLAVEVTPRVNTIAGRVLATIDVPSGTWHEAYHLPAGSVNSWVRWDGNDALIFAWSPSQAGRGEVVLNRLTLGSAKPHPVFSFISLPQRAEVAGPGVLLFDGGGNHRNLVDVKGDGTLGRALTGGPSIDRQPAFSPDGHRIVFSSDRSGSLDLWSLEVATAAVRRLTFDAADDWDPHWSPDGKHLLWSSNRSGHFEVWIADIDGTGARQVTSDGVDAENPTMSADGGWIVYSSANRAHSGIWKIRPDGSDATHLLEGSYQLPELAPKTGWIAATETGRALLALHPVRIIRLEDGGMVGEITVRGRGANMGRSRWMPDGRTLVSWGENDAHERVLYRQPVVPGRDTGSERVLVAVEDAQHKIDTFGVSPVDGRIVVSAGWGDTDLMLAEGIPGIGASLPKAKP